MSVDLLKTKEKKERKEEKVKNWIVPTLENPVHQKSVVKLSTNVVPSVIDATNSVQMIFAVTPMTIVGELMMFVI